MAKIYCKSREEFKDVQIALLSQGFKWQDSGKKIRKIEPSYENRAVIILNEVDKILWYKDGRPIVIGPDLISAENYILDYMNEKNKKVKQSIKNWIDKEFNIEL